VAGAGREATIEPRKAVCRDAVGDAQPGGGMSRRGGAALATGLIVWPMLQVRRGDASAPRPPHRPRRVGRIHHRELAAAEKHYQKGSATRPSRRKTPASLIRRRRMVAENLTVIDQAITKAPRCSRSRPAATRREGLFDAPRTKVALLQQTVELIKKCGRAISRRGRKLGRR
jgi:hypothetical protein